MGADEARTFLILEDSLRCERSAVFIRFSGRFGSLAANFGALTAFMVIRINEIIKAVLCETAIKEISSF